MLPSKSATPLFIVSIFLLIASCIEKLRRGNNFDAVTTDPQQNDIFTPFFEVHIRLNNPPHTPFDCCINKHIDYCTIFLMQVVLKNLRGDTQF